MGKESKPAMTTQQKRVKWICEHGYTHQTANDGCACECGCGHAELVREQP